jgi:formate/nitrite transporter FocA (FNT family)
MWTSGMQLDLHACISMSAVAQKFQLYRVMLAPFVHTGLAHVALNMLALLSVGPLQELSMGSVQFGYADFCRELDPAQRNDISSIFCVAFQILVYQGVLKILT